MTILVWPPRQAWILHYWSDECLICCLLHSSWTIPKVSSEASKHSVCFGNCIFPMWGPVEFAEDFGWDDTANSCPQKVYFIFVYKMQSSANSLALLGRYTSRSLRPFSSSPNPGFQILHLFYLAIRIFFLNKIFSKAADPTSLAVCPLTSFEK